MVSIRFSVPAAAWRVSALAVCFQTDNRSPDVLPSSVPEQSDFGSRSMASLNLLWREAMSTYQKAELLIALVVLLYI